MTSKRFFPRELEHEAIYIMREVAAQFEKPVLLFSGGKDSITLVHLARKAFYPAKVPFEMLNGKINVGENVRVFPISNWTELDVWNYIREEKLELPSIYFAHEREIILRDGLYWPYSEFLNTTEDEIPFIKKVRFRTVGDM